jgi:PleD family two-component response regulator
MAVLEALEGVGDLGPGTAAVLVVDDNAGKRLAVQAMLSPLGYDVVEADSGRAALRAVLAQHFAVILMDVRMPTMDGYETAKLAPMSCARRSRRSSTCSRSSSS